MYITSHVSKSPQFFIQYWQPMPSYGRERRKRDGLLNHHSRPLVFHHNNNQLGIHQPNNTTKFNCKKSFRHRQPSQSINQPITISINRIFTLMHDNIAILGNIKIIKIVVIIVSVWTGFMLLVLALTCSLESSSERETVRIKERA